MPEQTLISYVSLREQSCPNADCEMYEILDGKNVSVHGKKYERLQCKGCKSTWVSHKDAFNYRMRKDLETIQAALDFLDNGLSIRRTAKRVKVSPGTVQRWKNKFKQFNPNNHGI